MRSDDGLYLAAPEDIMKVIRSTGPRIPHLMIIGHNPGISDLAALLAPEPKMQDVATAGVRSLTFDVRTWSSVSPQSFRDLQSESPPAGLFRMWA
jgi:phosphohistidine phosphatase